MAFGGRVFIFYLFIYLAALSLHCCVQAFSNCREWGLIFVVVHGLLIAVASLVAEHRLQAHRLQQLWHVGSVVVAHGLSCSVARGIFLDQGSNLVSPALAGEFLTTVPPGKSLGKSFYHEWMLNFVTCFLSIEMIQWFLSFLLLMWCIILIDLCYVEPSLRPWNESNLIMVYDPFCVSLDSVC